jgi:mRNA-degrading endonuclease RelE of RelBE toxin-antitoxin system
MIDQVRYRVLFSKRALKDIEKLTPKLRNKLKDIVRNRLATEPHGGKHLVGNLQGYLSIRLTHRDRIVYRINENEKTVYIARTRSHYDLK